MTLSQAEQLKALASIQELDLRIGALRKQRDSLPGALKSRQQALTAAQSGMTSAEAARAEAEKVHRQTQAALEMGKERLARAHAKLESVHNGQEFQAANKEIDQLKKHNAQLEEQLAKSQAALDEGAKGLDGLRGKADQARVALDSDAGQAEGQSAEFDRQVAELMAARAKLTPGVDARVLATYDRVRAARAGIGLAAATGGRCGACNMIVAPQLLQEIRKGLSMHQCSCHRILYLSESAPAASPAAEKGV